MVSPVAPAALLRTLLVALFAALLAFAPAQARAQQLVTITTTVTTTETWVDDDAPDAGDADADEADAVAVDDDTAADLLARVAAVLAALAAHLALKKGKLTEGDEREIVKHLIEAPAALNAALAHDEEIAAMAHLIAPARDVLYLGRGPDYPLALEGALKLKEISYIHAEGYAAGEMKHGPIALIDEKVPVIVIAPSGPLFEKTISNMEEVRARGGQIVLISDAKGLEDAGEGCLATIEMPRVHPLIAPLVYAVPVQLLAYHVACVKGTDVDQPRNLAKSVTVE